MSKQDIEPHPGERGERTPEAGRWMPEPRRPARTTHRRPTMHDVAALAGVSLKTVSRVVNRELGVSVDLVQRVQQAADQLGYHPNLAASSLRRGTGHTSTLGLLLEDVANPFSGAVHRGIEDVAAVRGVAVLATSLDEDPLRERLAVRAMIRRRVDGLIVMPTGSDLSYLPREMQAGLAVVFVDRSPRSLDADTVLATNRAGAREAVEHLIAAGHRRLAFLGDLIDIATASDRYKGYADALQAAGIETDERLVRMGLRTREMASQAAEDVLRLPHERAPTAIFASQNLVTVGTVRTLHRLGLQHIVALVGFDDVELADLVDPGITVIAQDPYAMGRAAAELAFARIDGDHGPSQHRTISTRLVIRGSGEIPARQRDA